MTTLTDVTAKVSADIPAVTIVTAQVHDASPVAIAMTDRSTIAPSSIRVGYWNNGSDGMASLAIYGPVIVDGRITSMSKKSVYWVGDLDQAPEWAQEFVAEQGLLVTSR